MSKQAIEALLAERDLALGVMTGLSSEEWGQPSDCAGWLVQDVFAHMSAVFVTVAGGSVKRADDTPGDAERNADAGVEERRGRTPSAVVAEYTEWSDRAIAGLAAMQDEPLASTRIPLGNLGEHPMHILANALVFDHYCHLRHDLLRPNGPLDRPPLPRDELRLAPTMQWMLAGLPQMCAERLGVVDRAVNLVFTGPGGGSYVLHPSTLRDRSARTPPAIAPSLNSPVVTIEEGTDASAAATCSSTAHDFVSWGTQRRNWRASVELSGDVDYAARVLDAVNII